MGANKIRHFDYLLFQSENIFSLDKVLFSTFFIKEPILEIDCYIQIAGKKQAQLGNVNPEKASISDFFHLPRIRELNR